MASNPSRPADANQARSPLNVTAGVLSYLVPGLGQIYQGRYAKGILFLVSIYTLFFYGIYIGSGSVTLGGRKYVVNSNVYLPTDPNPNPKNAGFGRVPDSLVTRWQYGGQFWVGVAAWPAIFQFMRYDPAEQRKLEGLADDAGSAALRLEKAEQDLQDAEKAKADEEKLRMLRDDVAKARTEADEAQKEYAAFEKQVAHPIFGSFQREPSTASINAVNTAGDKRLELAWVFTVIAGVLNILVIYDAVAGPAVPPSAEKKGD